MPPRQAERGDDLGQRQHRQREGEGAVLGLRQRADDQDLGDHVEGRPEGLAGQQEARPADLGAVRGRRRSVWLPCHRPAPPAQPTPRRPRARVSAAGARDRHTGCHGTAPRGAPIARGRAARLDGARRGRRQPVRDLGVGVARGGRLGRRPPAADLPRAATTAASPRSSRSTSPRERPVRSCASSGTAPPTSSAPVCAPRDRREVAAALRRAGRERPGCGRCCSPSACPGPTAGPGCWARRVLRRERAGARDRRPRLGGRGSRPAARTSASRCAGASASSSASTACASSS